MKQKSLAALKPEELETVKAAVAFKIEADRQIAELEDQLKAMKKALHQEAQNIYGAAGKLVSGFQLSDGRTCRFHRGGHVSDVPGWTCALTQPREAAGVLEI